MLAPSSLLKVLPESFSARQLETLPEFWPDSSPDASRSPLACASLPAYSMMLDRCVGSPCQVSDAKSVPVRVQTPNRLRLIVDRSQIALTDR